MTLFTIGFTQTTAENFFNRLKKAKVETLIDTRLNNQSQLAGFAKKDDLPYFLKKIAKINYIHMPDLAPSKKILVDYREKKISWKVYEKRYLELIKKRKVEKLFKLKQLNNVCFLCSEAKPDHCHRRLLADFFKEKFKKLQITHL